MTGRESQLVEILAPGPEDFASYLRLGGWLQIHENRVSEVWTPPGADQPSATERQVIVPRLPTAPDFTTRIKILLGDLQDFERRSADEIRHDVALQHNDETLLRAHHDYGPSVFPLDSGQALFQSAKKLVVSAAAATLRRKGYFGKSTPWRAREQARMVMVGHTRPGSYVVPILSRARLPLATYEGNAPTLIPEVEEAAFDRRVLVTMIRALGALHSLAAAERTPTRRDIFDSVGDGISYDLCRGVLRSLKDRAVGSLAIGIRWAAALPSPGPSGVTVEFSREATGTIEYVAENLKNSSDDREQVLYGVVETLSSRSDDVGGRILFHTLIDGRPTVVQMALAPDDYQKALASHKQSAVIVRGRLHAELGRRANMEVWSFEPEQRLLGT